MSIGQEFPKTRACQKARHQRTQQPNTTHTITIATKDSQQLKRRSSIWDCPLYRTRRRPNQEKSYTTSTNSKRIYTKLYTEIHQPPTKTSQTHQQQCHRRHIPSERERHQKGSRQNIKNATTTLIQNINPTHIISTATYHHHHKTIQRLVNNHWTREESITQKQSSQNQKHTRIGNANKPTHTKTTLHKQMLEQLMPHMPQHSNKTPIPKHRTWNNTHN